MNLYNKIYGNVQETVPQFKNPEEALSFYLEGASKYLAKAALAATEERFEDRSNHSDNALKIFNGILSHLEQSAPGEKKAVQSLNEYCRLMGDLIIRMNIKNDVEMAENLTKEVKNMADHWKERSDFAIAKKATDYEGAEVTVDTSQQNVTMPNPTSPSPVHQGAKTADFSA